VITAYSTTLKGQLLHRVRYVLQETSQRETSQENFKKFAQPPESNLLWRLHATSRKSDNDGGIKSSYTFYVIIRYVFL
jgi:hypothetical protein